MLQPTFERAESELIKPPHHCIDLANFAAALKEVEQQNGARSRRSSAAFEAAPAADTGDAPELGVTGHSRSGAGAASLRGGDGGVGGGTEPGCSQDSSASPIILTRVGEGRTEDKSAAQLAMQGSYINPALPGLLGILMKGSRRAPMAPSVFEERLTKVVFTNGADRWFISQLYKSTSAAILRSVRVLRFVGLQWKGRDWTMLNVALRCCERLEELVLSRMSTLKSGDLEAIVQVLPQTMRILNLENCPMLGVLPRLTNIPRLETLLLTGCTSLSRIPDTGWGQLKRIKKIDLLGCELIGQDDIDGIIHLLSGDQFDQLLLIMPNGQVKVEKNL